MNKKLKVLLIVTGVVQLVAAGAGVFVWTQVSAFESSMEKVYEIAPVDLKVDVTPEVLARGGHLVESIGACAAGECHGKDLAGGTSIVMGPLGTLTGPNITGAGLGAVYSDGELARLIRHGVKKDGRSLRFMPAHEINWFPDNDLAAIVAYVRSVPDVKKPNGPMDIGLLAKILDRQDAIIIDVARRIDHEKLDLSPPPTPTAAYGKYIAKTCTGCHGEHLSGGPIPGAPSEFPIPPNITPDASGLKDWSLSDFNKLLDSGVRKNGKTLDPFMPIAALSKMNETERVALWEYLKSVPAKEFGNR